MSTETHPRARHPRTNLSRRFFRGAVGLGTGLGTLIAIGALLGTAVASPALTVHFLAPFTGTGSESTSTNADNCGAGSVTKVPTVKLHTGLATGATRSTISSTGCPAAAGGLTSLAYTSVYDDELIQIGAAPHNGLQQVVEKGKLSIIGNVSSYQANASQLAYSLWEVTLNVYLLDTTNSTEVASTTGSWFYYYYAYNGTAAVSFPVYWYEFWNATAMLSTHSYAVQTEFELYTEVYGYGSSSHAFASVSLGTTTGVKSITMN